MFYWLEYSFINLVNFEQRIFIKSLYCKNIVNIFAEIHPLDSLFSGVWSINIVNFKNLIKFRFSQNETQSGQNSLELISSDNIFSKIVKIKEELSDSDSFQYNLCLYFFHYFLDGKESFWYFLIDIKLLGNGIIVHVFDNISGGIILSFIGHNTFNNISFNFFNILNISNEISVSNLFWVDASAILSAQNVNQDLIFYQIQVIQHSDKLFSGYKTGFCPVVVLQLLFNEDSLAWDHPLNVRKETVECLGLLFGERLVVVFERGESGFSNFCVEELLIDGGNKINIPDKISRWDSVLVDDGFNLIVSETES